MKLVSFSVENYRSITTARKIPLSQYSLLVGANNEGKSNILHALTLAMNALVERRRQISYTGGGRIPVGPLRRSLGRYRRTRYDWDKDFPVGKQKSVNSDGASTITLEFELTEEEVQEFREEIKSNLNGTLPLSISFTQTTVVVSVRKPGRGGKSLTKKSNGIADFIARRIHFEYIPAIRTAESAGQVIEQLVDQELFRLEENEDYKEAVARIEELQRPVFEALAGTIKSTVSGFLPRVKSVELESRRDERYRALRRDIEIVIDDGQKTTLERKGDGVQSLVALALMRHAAQQKASGLSKVIAIEEPESHLHPRAVHELRTVIDALSENNQVVLTSHSPLFVNPDKLENTIIVKGSKAVCASHISEVRDALGVRFSDNLQNARLVLLVEGTDDVKAIKAIVGWKSQKLRTAMENGTVALDSLGGASGLRQKASFYLNNACMVQCFLDDDAAGVAAIKRAVGDKVVAVRDVNKCSVPHLTESELEDLYDKSVYGTNFLREFGVDPRKRPMGRDNLKAKRKWSKVMESLFGEAGKPWNDDIKMTVKNWLAEYAAANRETILKTILCGPLDSFIQSAENKLLDG